MGKLLLYCMSLLALTALLHAALPSINKSREIQKVTRKIRQIANKTHPHTFHVPVNVTNECLDSALMCFRSQTPKLHAATGKSKVELNSCIGKVKLSKIHDREGCTPCFTYAMQSPEEYLNNMEILLQKIVSGS